MVSGNNSEQTIARILKNVCSLDAIKIHDNFYQLWGFFVGYSGCRAIKARCSWK